MRGTLLAMLMLAASCGKPDPVSHPVTTPPADASAPAPVDAAVAATPTILDVLGDRQVTAGPCGGDETAAAAAPVVCVRGPDGDRQVELPIEVGHFGAATGRRDAYPLGVVLLDRNRLLASNGLQAAVVGPSGVLTTAEIEPLLARYNVWSPAGTITGGANSYWVERPLHREANRLVFTHAILQGDPVAVFIYRRVELFVGGVDGANMIWLGALGEPWFDDEQEPPIAP